MMKSLKKIENIPSQVSSQQDYVEATGVNIDAFIMEKKMKKLTRKPLIMRKVRRKKRLSAFEQKLNTKNHKLSFNNWLRKLSVKLLLRI
jgi:hypothetical protein